MKQGQTYWLIGASAGLGRALASQMADAGISLVLSARNKARLDAMAQELPGNHRVLPLDLRSSDSVKQAARDLPVLDGVIYMAGDYDPMRAENFDPDRAEMVADVNFMGAIRALGAVVPEFARRDRGHVVIIGSLAGFRGLPGAIGYGASKAGVMHLAENLRADLWRTGVKVQLVNPGFIRTRLTDKNDFKMPQIMEPETAARHVMAAMRSNRFSTSFPNPFAMVFRVSRWLPQGLYQRLFASGKRAR